MMCIGLETVDADTEQTRLNSVSVTNVAKFFLKCVMALHCILNSLGSLKPRLCCKYETSSKINSAF